MTSRWNRTSQPFAGVNLARRSSRWLAAALLSLAAFAGHAQVTYPLNSNGSMGLGSPNGDFAVAQDDMQVKVPGGYIRINRDFDGRQWVFNRQWSGMGNPSYYKASYASIGSYFTCDIIDGISSCDSNSSSHTVLADVPDLDIQQTRIPNDPSFGRDAEGQPVLGLSTAPAVARKGVGFTRSTDGTSYVSSKYPRFVVRPQSVPTLPTSAGPDAHPTTGKPGQGGVATVQADGFRWTDRSGEWIEYDNFGRISSYGDRNNVRVWFQYGSHGQVERILDDNGRTVFTLLYKDNGSFITEARDHTPLDGNIRRVQYNYDDDGRLRRVTDARGHDTLFEYGNGGADGLGTSVKMVKVTDAEGRETKITYGITGRIEKISAPDGGVVDIEYGYDKLKKEFSTTVKHPETASGRKIETRHYDVEGRMVFREVNGKTLSFALGSRKSMNYTDERGHTFTAVRDNFDQITNKTNSDGSSIIYTYSSGSLDLDKVVDETGAITQFNRDGHGNLTTLKAAVGKPEEQVTEYEVNARGEAEMVRRKGGPTPGGGTDQDVEVHVAYDANGNIRELTDGEGKIWKYEYDALGNLARALDPLNHEWSYTHDAHGNRLSVTDPNGLISHFTYDKTDRLLTAADPRGKVYRLEYDSIGRVQKVVDPAGAAQTQEYDRLGQLISSFDSMNQRVQFGYDRQGRMTSMIDGEGNATGFDYSDVDGSDIGSDLVSKINYPTLQRTLRYNNRNSLTQLADVVDGDTRTTTAAYDGRGALTSSTNAYGKSQSTQHDALGRPIVSMDELGHAVQLDYDHRGNLISATDELGHVLRMEYDRRDKLVKETNALGQATVYNYDDAGRLQELLRPNGARLVFDFDPGGRLVTRRSYRGDGGLELTDSFSWDGGNRLAGWTTNNASSTSTFDDANRLLSETVTVDGVPLTRSYTYHSNGQIKTYTGPDGVTIAYFYDGNGGLSRVDIPGEGSISVTERQWAEAKKVVLPGGTVQEIERNALLSLTRMRVKSPSQSVLFDQQGTYGKLDELSSRTTQGRQIDYSYDDALRLLEADPAGWSGTTETFEIDAADNRLRDNLVQSAWEYDDANRLTTRGNITYQYDPAGNLVKRTDSSQSEPLRTTNYTYDGYDRLVAVHDGAGQLISRYAYDPFGYRLSKEITATGASGSGATAGKRLFLNADEGLLAEVSEDGSILQSYGWNPNRTYSTAPLYTRVGDGYFYYQNDPLGVPYMLTDKAGNVVWSASVVSAFGATAAAAGSSIEQPWRLPGQYFDAETGLHYNVHRYYSPETGRYITSDPAGLDGGLNRYAYGQASPGNFIDPYGLRSFPESNGPIEHIFGGIYWLTDGASPPQGLVDFSAGAGDTFSFGITKLIREKYNIGSVDYCSTEYTAGEWTATVAGLLFGVGEVNAAARAGKFASNAAGKPWGAYSSKWKNVSERVRGVMGLKGNKGIELHHWLIERNSFIGKHFPDWIKNHPWNLNPVSKTSHVDLHGMDWLSRTMLGAPSWAQRAGAEAAWPAAGHIANELTEPECGCE